MDHPIRWESVEFADKATYEGLTRADQAHVRGVLTFSDGSYYCGEFRDNEYSGFGVYTWPAQGDGGKGTSAVMRGEWRDSRANGCGVRLTKQKNGKVVAEEGEFKDDEWLGVTKACSVKAAREAARFADVAGLQAQVSVVVVVARSTRSLARSLTRSLTRLLALRLSFVRQAFQLEDRETSAVKPKGADAIIKSMNKFRLRKR